MRRVAVLTAALAAALVSPRPAGAYVRYTSNSGKMFKWPQSCVQLTTYPADMQDMMSVEEILGAIDASAAAWSGSADSCTYLNISVASSSDPTPRATNDGHNLVIFRHESWCKLTENGSCDPAISYDAAALALTSVSASTSTGNIRDADIEVNAYNFLWADLVTHSELRGAGMSYHDLQNAVTHEMGHLIGLDHTCFFDPPAPLDSTGTPIPDCMDASPAILATTMFPSANPGDIDKRTLAPDDQMAVCDIYPASQDPMMCTAPGMPKKGGCSYAAAAAPTGTAGLGALIAAALLIARARRRRG